MTKYGYLLLGMLIVGLGAYTLWPTGGVRTVGLGPGPDPQTLTVVAGGLRQEIAGETVTLAGFQRPLDRARLGRLWILLSDIQVDPADVRAGVAADQLAAYGIDGSSHLVGATVDCSWGVKDGDGFLYDARARCILPLPKGMADDLTRLCARLDRSELVDTTGLQRVEADGVELVNDGDGFFDAKQPERPDCAHQVEILLGLVGALRLDRIDATLPGGAQAVSSLRLVCAPRPAGDRLTLYRLPPDSGGAVAGLVAAEGLPPQALPPPLFKAWQEALADLRADHLFYVASSLGGNNPIDAVVVKRAGAEWFRLELRGLKEQVAGRSQWDLVWADGRETAVVDGAARIAAAMDLLTVTNVRRRRVDEPVTVPEISLRIIGKLLRNNATIELSNGEARSPTHVGRVASISEVLSAISPDRFLDPVILARSSDRVVKLQRVVNDEIPKRAEVLRRAEAGGWQQVLPERRAVDAVAVERQVRAVAQGRARSAALITAANRSTIDAINNDPDVELDLRIAAKEVGKADDATDLDDTTARDFGLAIKRIDGEWRAADRDGGISYVLDDEMMELIRQPLIDHLVCPVVPALVAEIDIGDGKATRRIFRDGDGWTALDGSARVAVDAIAVRRLLQLVADLHARRIDPPPQGRPLVSAETALTLTCYVPSGGETRERLALHLGSAVVGLDEVAISAEAAQPDAVLPGRGWLSADDARQLTDKVRVLLPIPPSP